MGSKCTCSRLSTNNSYSSVILKTDETHCWSKEVNLLVRIFDSRLVHQEISSNEYFIWTSLLSNSVTNIKLYHDQMTSVTRITWTRSLSTKRFIGVKIELHNDIITVFVWKSLFRSLSRSHYHISFSNGLLNFIVFVWSFS